MNLRIELKGGAMTASMRGELDHHTAGEMREQIDSTAKKVRPQKLILDFKEVPFMDSSGIGLILGVSARRRCGAGASPYADCHRS